MWRIKEQQLLSSKVITRRVENRRMEKMKNFVTFIPAGKGSKMIFNHFGIGSLTLIKLILAVISEKRYLDSFAVKSGRFRTILLTELLSASMFCIYRSF